jgi:hypothetical protein
MQLVLGDSGTASYTGTTSVVRNDRTKKVSCLVSRLVSRLQYLAFVVTCYSVTLSLSCHCSFLKRHLSGPASTVSTCGQVFMATVMPSLIPL